MNAITGLYSQQMTADRARLPAKPTTEQLANDALLAMSKLRDRLVVENWNSPACRVDEAMEATLVAARAALALASPDEGG